MGGSFIPSLKALELENSKRGNSTIFVFPKMGENLPWAKQFSDAIWIDNDFFLKRKLSIKYIKQLYAIIRKYKITHIVTNFIGYNVNLWIIKKLSKLPCLQVVHNTFHQLSPNRVKCYIKQQLLEQTYDKFIGVSEWVATSMLQNGLSYSKITWVRNAVDFERLEHFEKYNFKENSNEYVIFMMGWPYYVKGVDVAIRAISLLRDGGINAILVTPHDNIKRDLLQDVGFIPEFVRFVKAREDIATYLNNIDIFLSASREEGCPYAIVEAAFSQAVVISSDIPASMQLKIPNIIYFKSEDYQGLIDNLKWCFNNNDKCLANKEKQRQYVIREFDMCIWASNLLNVLMNKY